MSCQPAISMCHDRSAQTSRRAAGPQPDNGLEAKALQGLRPWLHCQESAHQVIEAIPGICDAGTCNP